MTTPILALNEITESQSSKYLTHNTALRDLEQAVIAKVATVIVGMQTADGKGILYFVPAGMKFIPMQVIVRNPSGSLAGGTDFDFGDGIVADNWKAAVDLSGLTAVTDCIVLTNDNAKFTVYDAADEFGILPITGATADVNATIDVLGYVFDGTGLPADTVGLKLDAILYS